MKPEESQQVERLRPSRRQRRSNSSTDSSEEYFFKIGERLFHLKRRIKTTNLQEEELPPPDRARSGQWTVIAAPLGAFAVLLTVSLAFIQHMGPDPEVSANALTKVIATLGSALGAGIIGIAFKALKNKK